MISPTITDGQLLAYLDGVRLPAVESALAVSPALRARLETLRSEEFFLREMFINLPVIEPQDLVDVVTGQASPATRLRVNAYLKENPEAKEEMETLKKSLPQTSTSRRPAFAAIPVLAAGLRDAGAQSQNQSYYVAELEARVSLSITPCGTERWRVSGRVTCANQAIVGVRVALSSANFHPRPRQTDENGFFEFQRLPTDVYSLRVTLVSGILVIREIDLGND